MAENKFGQMYRNNITNTRISSLWGKNTEGTGASFNCYISGNTLRLRIFTGMQADKEKKVKSINFDFKEDKIIDFVSMINTLLEIDAIPFESGNAVKQVFSINGFINGKKERGEIGKIIVGRDGDGVYFISGINNSHGKVKFPITFNSRDTVIYNLNTNEPADEHYKSKMFMRSWVSTVKDLVATVLTQEYVEPKKQSNTSNNSNAQNNSTPDSGYSDDLDDIEW